MPARQIQLTLDFEHDADLDKTVIAPVLSGLIQLTNAILAIHGGVYQGQPIRAAATLTVDGVMVGD